MRAYRLGVNLKAGLLLFAVLIAFVSLWYTNRLVDRLREREQGVVQLWARALQQVPKTQALGRNPYAAELRELDDFLRADATALDAEQAAIFRQAVRWAQGMPPSVELSFIMDDILVPNTFDIPAILTDSARHPQTWRNVRGVPASIIEAGEADTAAVMRRLEQLRDEMAATYAPIPIELDYGSGPPLIQYVHYGESPLVRELRIFPYVQLLFVAFFILIGYVGFSYVRRSEQSSLWVGMAKEAAHQLGTPISSLMGWIELFRIDGLPPGDDTMALDEMEKDVARLRRVASRFSDIGSLPKLDVQHVGPVVEATADYIRRRLPQRSGRTVLNVDVPATLRAPINAELFEWVIENLLKNALDAMTRPDGVISVMARQEGGRIHIDIQDTGRGIERREWKNVFRPGYSTKTRGWGLGLSLARRIVVDYHGGTLTLVSSRVGYGTTFRIELPAALPAPPATPAPSSARAAGTA